MRSFLLLLILGWTTPWTGSSVAQDSVVPEFELPEMESPYDEPIETDRHDFTQSPKVVGRGVKQIEYGVFYSTRSNGGERETTYATPEILARYGISERAEIRARFNYGWKYNNEEIDIQGSEDLVLGLKLQWTEQSGRKPELATEFRLTAPTGADEISTGRWEPGIDTIYGWEIGERFTLTGSTGANANGLDDIAFITFETDSSDRFIAWTQSTSFGARITPKTTAYFEWYGIFTSGLEEESSLGFLNFGFDYLVNKNVVVDLRIGWGLTEESDDLFAGIGGAFRF